MQTQWALLNGPYFTPPLFPLPCSFIRFGGCEIDYSHRSLSIYDIQSIFILSHTNLCACDSGQMAPWRQTLGSWIIHWCSPTMGWRKRNLKTGKISLFLLINPKKWFVDRCKHSMVQNWVVESLHGMKICSSATPSTSNSLFFFYC